MAAIPGENGKIPSFPMEKWSFYWVCPPFRVGKIPLISGEANPSQSDSTFQWRKCLSGRDEMCPNTWYIGCVLVYIWLCIYVCMYIYITTIYAWLYEC
jgi:hypothetical protein